MCSCVFVLPGHGQCYCGNCYCAAGWHGDKCEFQCDISPWESRRRCTSPDGKICSNRGLFTYTFHISAYITLILFSHLTGFSLFLGFCKQLHTFTACFLAFQFSKYNGETTIHFFLIYWINFIKYKRKCVASSPCTADRSKSLKLPQVILSTGSFQWVHNSCSLNHWNMSSHEHATCVNRYKCTKYCSDIKTYLF